MAFVLPAVAAFAAAGGTIAGVGAALTGAAGFATFASVAGGFIASAGMLTKNKTLTKVGSILGLVGAVTSLASSLAGSASSATGEAASSAAGDALAETAKEGAAESLTSGMAETPLGEGLGKIGEGAAQGAGEAAAATGAPMALEQPAGNLLDQYRAGMVDGSDYGLMSRNAAQAAAPSASPAGVVVDGSDYGLTSRGLATQSVITDARQASALAQAGAQIKDQTALQAVLDKLSSAGKWVKENKELAQIGGQVLAGGAQSYQRGQEFDEQMNLLEARRRRLNNPVVMGGVQPVAMPMKIGG